MPLIQFCVNSYVSDSLPVSAQRALNVYAEKEPPDTKTPIALFGVPGITSWATVGDGPIRGTHVMNEQLYVVSGRELYVVDQDGGPALIGDIGSAVGPIVMSDNGYQLVILDNGQLYVAATELLARAPGGQLNARKALTLSGAIVTTLSLNGGVNDDQLSVNYANALINIVPGDNIIVNLDNGSQFNTQVGAGGFIPGFITLSGAGSLSGAEIGYTVNDVTTAGANTLIAFNRAPSGATTFQVQNITPILVGDTIEIQLNDGTNYTGTVTATQQHLLDLTTRLPSNASIGNEVADLTTHLFACNDTNFYPAQTVTFFDDYFVFDRFGTNEFILSAIGDGTTYPPLYFASALVNPDNVVAVISDHEMLLIFGDKTIESWYDAGLQNFPFQRYDGATVERGLAAPLSIVKEDNAVFFLGDDKIYYRLQGVLPIRVSTHAIEATWGKYTKISDAFAFSYTIKGHKFINLIFPSGTGTFVFDVATGLWHERDSYDLNGNLLGMWRVSCACTAYNKTIVGDSLSNQIGYMDETTYTEFGSTILGQACGSPVRSNRNRIFWPKFEIEVETGVGEAGNLPNVITLTTNLPSQASINNAVTDLVLGGGTTLTTIAPVGANTIQVENTTDMSANDAITIMLDSGILFTSVIKSIMSPSNPQIYFDYSDDGGHTFSTPQLPRALGSNNQYTARQRWLRLGQSRLRYPRLTITDPVKRVIVAAYLNSYEGIGI
jgi:hypothetical protein